MQLIQSLLAIELQGGGAKQWLPDYPASSPVCLAPVFSLYFSLPVLRRNFQKNIHAKLCVTYFHSLFKGYMLSQNEIQKGKMPYLKEQMPTCSHLRRYLGRSPLCLLNSATYLPILLHVNNKKSFLGNLLLSRCSDMDVIM